MKHGREVEAVSYTQAEFLAVAETLGYRRVNQSDRMGGLPLAGNDGAVWYVRGWEECASPDDVEKLLRCYPALERSNRAAAMLGRIKSAAKAQAARENGKKGGRPRKLAGALPCECGAQPVIKDGFVQCPNCGPRGRTFKVP